MGWNDLGLKFRNALAGVRGSFQAQEGNKAKHLSVASVDAPICQIVKSCNENVKSCSVHLRRSAGFASPGRLVRVFTPTNVGTRITLLQSMHSTEQAPTGHWVREQNLGSRIPATVTLYYPILSRSSYTANCRLRSYARHGQWN